MIERKYLEEESIASSVRVSKNTLLIAMISFILLLQGCGGNASSPAGLIEASNTLESSFPESSIVDIPENKTDSIQLFDVNDSSLRYAIEGEDSDLFSIDKITGILTLLPESSAKEEKGLSFKVGSNYSFSIVITNIVTNARITVPVVMTLVTPVGVTPATSPTPSPTPVAMPTPTPTPVATPTPTPTPAPTTTSTPTTVASVAQTDKFIFTIDTRLATAQNQGTLNAPVTTVYQGQQTYLYNIDCNNDGTDEAVNQSSTYTCSYPTPGIYQVAIYGDIPRVSFDATLGDAVKLTSVDQWGTNVWKTFNGIFTNCSNLLTVSTTDIPDLSQVTDMSGMFQSATNFNSNINNWDVSHVTNMNSAFFEAESFNLSLNSWDVSNVTNMYGMFSDATVFNGDISAWNVGRVTDMNSMFLSVSAFNQNIGAWNVVNVTDMNQMFTSASNFNQDIGTWNVSNVTNMSAMFQDASSFNQDISAWNVSNVTNMISTFQSATVFNQDISSWDVSEVLSMYSMFNNALAFNQDISLWNIEKVKYIDIMFYNAVAFNQDLSAWQPLQLLNAYQVFTNSAFNTANYDLLLNTWSQLSLQSNVRFDTDAVYTNAVSGTAHANMINNFSWTINDGGFI